eukprot:TRINITY_DN45533_c0_g1_i1.p1 TRINITY_DN45533_c0_g1~~TRINITY_DN45533_c0_g1_i1.p1  ORF type:complete len:560 (+),score=58.15 TRINITY_DN45533_c0_g1_i1:74-1753(+)
MGVRLDVMTWQRALCVCCAACMVRGARVDDTLQAQVQVERQSSQSVLGVEEVAVESGTSDVASKIPPFAIGSAASLIPLGLQKPKFESLHEQPASHHRTPSDQQRSLHETAEIPARNEKPALSQEYRSSRANSTVSPAHQHSSRDAQDQHSNPELVSLPHVIEEFVWSSQPSEKPGVAGKGEVRQAVSDQDHKSQHDDVGTLHVNRKGSLEQREFSRKQPQAPQGYNDFFHESNEPSGQHGSSNGEATMYGGGRESWQEQHEFPQDTHEPLHTEVRRYEGQHEAPHEQQESQHEGVGTYREQRESFHDFPHEETRRYEGYRDFSQRQHDAPHEEVETYSGGRESWQDHEPLHTEVQRYEGQHEFSREQHEPRHEEVETYRRQRESFGGQRDVSQRTHERSRAGEGAYQSHREVLREQDDFPREELRASHGRRDFSRRTREPLREEVGRYDSEHVFSHGQHGSTHGEQGTYLRHDESFQGNRDISQWDQEYEGHREFSHGHEEVGAYQDREESPRVNAGMSRGHDESWQRHRDRPQWNQHDQVRRDDFPALHGHRYEDRA